MNESFWLPEEVHVWYGTAFRCWVCNEPPKWRVVRSGDAVVTWSCGNHVHLVLDRLHAGKEAAELVVTLTEAGA